MICRYLLFWTFAAAVSPDLALAKNYELGLYKSLLSKYNKLERPVEDNRKPITVKLGLVLNQIIDIEDRSEVMHLNVWLNFVSITSYSAAFVRNSGFFIGMARLSSSLEFYRERWRS